MTPESEPTKLDGTDYLPYGGYEVPYLKTSPWLSLIIRGDGRRIVGTAVRTGITRPFYKALGVYRIHVGSYDPTTNTQSSLPGYWVLDSDGFHNSIDWHRNPDNLEEVKQPEKKGRKSSAKS